MIVLCCVVKMSSENQENIIEGLSNLEFVDMTELYVSTVINVGVLKPGEKR